MGVKSRVGQYVYEKSNRKNKKLMTKVEVDGKTKTIHFGDSRYQHYKDKTGIWSKLDHNDKVRRKNYHMRHGDSNDPKTAKYHANRILW